MQQQQQQQLNKIKRPESLHTEKNRRQRRRGHYEYTDVTIRNTNKQISY